MFRTDSRSGPLPLPTERRVSGETPKSDRVSGGESSRPDGAGALPDRLLGNLRGDPTIPDQDYAPILDLASDPLSERTVTQAHGHDDALVGKLVDTHNGARDPEVELAVSLAHDTAVLDGVVNDASGGHISKLSEQVSAETLKTVKDDLADAIRSEPHEPDHDVLGARQEKRSPFQRVKEAVTGAIDRIRRAVAREPVRSVVKQVEAFSAERLKGKSDQQVMREMGAQIGRLSNTDLLKTYRASLSLDMLEYRMGLANRAEAGPEHDPEACLLLESLNSYEAVVHTEVLERSLQRAGEVDGFELIDHGPKLGQMGALASTEKRAAHRELDIQSDAYLRGDPWADRAEHLGAAARLGNTGLTVEQVSEALRSADLTINLGANLFAKGGAFRDESGALVSTAPRLKNIYELPQAKGPQYLARRQMVEYALEPATARADRSGIDPANHPISAGVNVGRKIAGAAPGYGEVVLVLKDSVKDRCTFTASDSFNAPFTGARATPEKVAQFKARVAEMLEPGGGLSEPDRQRLREQGTALTSLFSRLDQMAARAAAGDPADTGFPTDRPMDQFLHYDLLREIDEGRVTRLSYELANAAMDCFMDKPLAGSDHVTTPERMAHIIPALKDDAIQAIADGQDPRRINLPVSNYVEAQVYGGIDLASDVAEIRFFEKDVSAMTPQQKAAYLDSVDGLNQIAQELAVRVVRYRPEEAKLTHLDT